jgi:LysM domain
MSGMAGQINESALWHRSWRRRGAGLIVAGLLGLHAAAAIAACDELLTVRVKEGQSLRDLAQQYLGDPDLWTEILRANGLALGDVHPGTELKIPAGQIAAANKALGEALIIGSKRRSRPKTTKTVSAPSTPRSLLRRRRDFLGHSA